MIQISSNLNYNITYIYISFYIIENILQFLTCLILFLLFYLTILF